MGRALLAHSGEERPGTWDGQDSISAPISRSWSLFLHRFIRLRFPKCQWSRARSPLCISDSSLPHDKKSQRLGAILKFCVLYHGSVTVSFWHNVTELRLRLNKDAQHRHCVEIRSHSGSVFTLSVSRRTNGYKSSSAKGKRSSSVIHSSSSLGSSASCGKKDQVETSIQWNILLQKQPFIVALQKFIFEIWRICTKINPTHNQI